MSDQFDDLTPDEQAELDAELSSFSEVEAKTLGITREQYTENVASEFWAHQRAHTTLLVSGLSLAHDHLVCAALAGLGYKVAPLDVPDQESLRYGKEFGNRGQCSPTYFTVGNLVKSLVHMRDVQGIATQDIIDHHVFLTAGGCGPCRFGMYVTEYRKALRDAGFDGFRVLTFQMAGGVHQATGEELGIKFDPTFAWTIVRALIIGDSLNILGYRLRPYEIEPGATDAAMDQCKAYLNEAFRQRKSIPVALIKCRRAMRKVRVDRTVAKPIVSVIGEFWAMTTEGDGNYHMQRFLEQEGAEVDIQGITNWLLFLVWEAGFDTRNRQALKEDDEARKGLKGKDAVKQLWKLKAADKLIRGLFHFHANLMGLHSYHLPDMQQMADLSKGYYDHNVRGGEAFLEVGKLVHFIVDQVNHMTLSVKPFGCMPSSGVSDGVQASVTGHFPEAIFLPIETTGDQQVNAHSRVQMMLYKARQKASTEFEKALNERGWSKDEFEARLNKSRRFGRNPLWRPKHRKAGAAANLVYAL